MPLHFAVMVLKGHTTTSLLASNEAVDMGLVAGLDEVVQKGIGLMKATPVKVKTSQ